MKRFTNYTEPSCPIVCYIRKLFTKNKEVRENSEKKSEDTHQK